MTRINVVPVSELTDKHLVAEYRELPRIYNAALKFYVDGEKGNVPEIYVLGTGHMKFFYYKLNYIHKRHIELIEEMKTRGFHTNFTGEIPENIKLPKRFWNDYIPTNEAIALNRKRIKERIEDSIKRKENKK